MKQAHAMRFPTCTRQTGLSLVELMVGMLVGLIGIIIISHLYITNEQYKRSTTGSGAAQVNGAVALYTIERLYFSLVMYRCEMMTMPIRPTSMPTISSTRLSPAWRAQVGNRMARSCSIS